MAKDRRIATTLTLVDLAGSIALLLWGVHMVQTGIQRAFGAGLRRALGVALGSRLRAFLAGLATTAMLQSSTATGLMVSSFAASGLVDLVPALVARRLKRGLAFRPQDRAKLSGVFDRLSANLRIAGAVFMTEDGEAARALAAEKEVFRELERQAMAAQFAAFRRGRQRTPEAARCFWTCCATPRGSTRTSWRCRLPGAGRR